MRLLFVCPELRGRSAPPGARLVHNLARMAQREGHRVRVVATRADALVPLEAAAGAPAGARSGLADGVPVWLVPPGSDNDAGPPFKPGQVGQQFDLAHAVATADEWPLIEWVAGCGLPLIVTLVGLPGPERAPLAALRRALGKDRVRVVVPSLHAAACWQPVLPACDLQVLPHGVDLLALLGSSARAGTALPMAGEPTLLCAAPFERRSGVGELLRSFAQVRRPGLRLRLLCEAESDSATALALRQAAAADPRVSIEPSQGPTSLTAVAGPFDLVCLPALDEQAFSMLALECAALGVGCLASDVGAQAEAVRRFRCGAVLPAGDVDAWAHAIDDWAAGFGRQPGIAVCGALPMRIEEEAFLYEALYRERLFAVGA